MRKKNIDGINRIMDVNINRAKEGLRVCEEVARFILNSRFLTSRFKQTRHTLNRIVADLGDRRAFILRRESRADVGRTLTLSPEIRRKDFRDIFFANLQRIKESLRVLEEFAKLSDTKAALRFKQLRYTVYEIEKKIAEKIVSVRHNR